MATANESSGYYLCFVANISLFRPILGFTHSYTFYPVLPNYPG